jgi:hypothetical protein
VSLATLLEDFARLCAIEAERVDPPAPEGHPDHRPRWSRNDRRHLFDTANEVRARLSLLEKVPESVGALVSFCDR